MMNLKKTRKPKLLKELNKNIVLNIIIEESPISVAKASKIAVISKNPLCQIL
jgi:hypothetical protein